MSGFNMYGKMTSEAVEMMCTGGLRRVLDAINKIAERENFTPVEIRALAEYVNSFVSYNFSIELLKKQIKWKKEKK